MRAITQPTISELELGEELPQGVTPTCCGTDMDLDLRIDGNDWTCLTCRAFVATEDGIVVAIDC